jgi:ribosome biogenesis protein Tsr3
LKHPKEKNTKSSAWPSQFLSEDVTIVESYDQAQTRFSEKKYKKVAILYPHKESKLVSELTEEELAEIEAVMAVDCTWHQAKYIIKDLPDKPESNQAFVILKDYKTTF